MRAWGLSAGADAVIAGVLSADEVQDAVGKQWDFMEGLGTGIDRHVGFPAASTLAIRNPKVRESALMPCLLNFLQDPSTWGNDKWQPGAPGTGIIGGFGVGHNAASWSIRSNKNVQAVWKQIHGTSELLTSYDGMCLFRPRGLNEDWTTRGGWFHTDRPLEGPNGIGRGYVQGFVNLVKTSLAGGGNVIVPRSHKLYEGFLQQFGKDGRMDNEALKESRPDVFSGARYIHLEAGGPSRSRCTQHIRTVARVCHR
eukprot:SAG31_NODE_4776_length_2961_cov_5.154437_3_plen_254_part_00